MNIFCSINTNITLYTACAVAITISILWIFICSVVVGVNISDCYIEVFTAIFLK